MKNILINYANIKMIKGDIMSKFISTKLIRD